MATNFNNKLGMPSPMIVGSKAANDLPLDVRTRIETIDEMEQITFPYIGMMVYVKDEDKFYVVKTLKGAETRPGVAATYTENYLIDTYEEFNPGGVAKNLVFDTLAEAEDYATNDTNSYNGQIIHIKDARTNDEIANGINIYEETCYIDYYKAIKTICTFTYEALGMLLNILYNINDGMDMSAEIDELKALILDTYTHDFSEFPNE